MVQQLPISVDTLFNEEIWVFDDSQPWNLGRLVECEFTFEINFVDQ